MIAGVEEAAKGAPATRSLGRLLFALVLGLTLTGATLALGLSLRLGPVALANRAYSDRVRLLLAVTSARSHVISSALTRLHPVVRARLAGSREYTDRQVQELIALLRGELDSTIALRTAASIGPLPPEVRFRLAVAAELDSRLAYVLEGLRSSLQLGDSASSALHLAELEGVAPEMIADLSQTERVALEGLVERDSLLSVRSSEVISGLAIATVLVALLAVSGVVLIYRRLVHPLAELDAGLARVAAGDYGVRLAPGIPDELGRLRVQFNLTTQVLGERDSRTRRSAQRLEQILDDASDEVFLLDAQSLRIRQASRTALENLGYAAAELAALTYPDLVPGLTLERFEQRLRPLRAGERMQQVSASTHRRKDGSSYPIEGRLQFFGEDEPPVFVLIAQDVSERMHAEQSLRESEDRFRTAFADAPVGMLLLGLDGEILLANRRFAEMVGIGAVALTGRLLDSLGAEDGESVRFVRRIRALLDDPAAPGVSFEQEYLGVGRRPVVGRTHVSLQRSPGGTPLRCIVQVEDVSEQRRLEAQLRQAQRIEAVGQLAGGIAHDFNNILTAMVAYVVLVRDTLEPADPRRSDLDQVLGASERAATLVRQLLAFAREERVDPRVVELGPLIRGLAPMLERLLGAHFRLDLRLPESTWRVRLDPNLFDQVIVNLVLNARDAMPHGGLIALESENVVVREPLPHAPQLAVGAYATVRVSDRGVGMTPEVRERIFEPFFTTKAVGEGSGLGLAMCYGAMKQAGGFIYAESEPGRGTTMHLYLPRDAAPVDGRKAPAPAERALPGGSERVLLVEDESRVLAAASRLLGSLGYRVLTADDGPAGLALGRRHLAEIDLLVTDIVLPDLSGTELAARLMAERPDLRVLYTSGYSRRYLASDSALPTEADFLPKPYTPPELARRVREALDRGRDPGGAAPESR